MTPYYERGGITIYHGDCLEVLPTLGPVDHVITDPPYARDVYVRIGLPNTKAGSGTPARLLGESFSLNNGARLGQLAAGAIGAIDDMIEPCAAEFARLVRRWCLVFSDVESCHLWRAALEDGGMRYVRTGAWVKPDAMPQMSGDRPATGFEPCTITHAKGPMRWNGGGHAAVWTHNTSKGADRPDHPCPKPLPLMRELVSLFTDAGELILDPFMGSGTTLRAAKDLGRRAIGIELEEKWCEVAAKRLEQQVLAI
ncbi:MAG: site-specific DNA-methyltransferase [Vicinamibacterales bacterium]